MTRLRAADTEGTMPRHALVVRGGWDGHMPVETTDLFIPFLRDNGFDVRVEEGTAVYADDAAMADVDLIVQIVTMSTIADDEFAGLQRAVLGGTGLAGWHGGIADAFRNTADYLHMIGGQFAHHAGKHPSERTGEQSDNYIPYTVHITDAGREHPITQGIEDFDLVTEQYWVLSDEYNDVLADDADADDPDAERSGGRAPHRAAHRSPRSMIVRSGCDSTTSSRCPGAETNTRPSPHCRVQIAGAVTGRFQASKSRASCVVVASTSLYSSESTQYCSVTRSKSSMPCVIGCSCPASVMCTVYGM